MQKPTDLASLRDFTEWKKDCDVKVGFCDNAMDIDYTWMI